MVMVHTRDLEKLMDCDSTGSNNETIKSLKARYKKLFTIQKDSTFLQVWHLKLNIQNTILFIFFLLITEPTRGLATGRLWKGQKSGSQEIGGMGARAKKFQEVDLSQEVSSKLKIWVSKRLNDWQINSVHLFLKLTYLNFLKQKSSWTPWTVRRNPWFT